MANAHLVYGHGSNNHVYSEDIRSIHTNIYGDSKYSFSEGDGLEPDIVSNTEIQIGTGAFMMYGAYVRVTEAVSVTIASGTSGMKRKDLIIARYTRDEDTGVEEVNIEAVTGTPTSGNAVIPYSKINGNGIEGYLVSDVSMYVVTIDGFTIKKVESTMDFKKITKVPEMLLEIVDTQNDMQSSLSYYSDELENETHAWWVNSETIYKKTFSGTLTKQTWSKVIQNVANVVKIEGTIKDKFGVWWPFPFYKNSNYYANASYTPSTKTLKLETGAYVLNTDFVITIYYTKF